MSARPERPVVLVTGANRGIGRAIAQRLAADHVVIRHARADADLADPGAVARFVAGLSLPVHVLVNNAGVAPSAPLSRTDDEVWARTIAVNLTAPFMLARALIPSMIAAGWGRVVNVVSTAGLKGYAYTAAYSASKGGLLALTRSLAAEFARKPVTINAVCPGFTDTRIVQEAIANITAKTARTEAEARASLEKFSPQGRLIDPREVAAMVAYLVSDDAASITGAALPLDGGETSL